MDLNRNYNLTGEFPLVTVITAVFNGKPYIDLCIESVLKQDYPNVEHIVIDGGSTDGTIDVLNKYSEQLAFWRSEPDNGVYDAWNKALAVANGEWICFLGADDEFQPGAISTYMKFASEHPELEYISSQERWVHSSGYERIRGGPWKWKRFIRSMCVAHVGSMHHRSLFKRLGTYDTSFGSAADYEFLLRAQSSLRAGFIPAITVMMRAGGMSNTLGAFAEATRAKIVTGGRNPVVAKIELLIAGVKFPLRPLRRMIGKALS